MKLLELKPSTRDDKKYMVVIEQDNGRKKTIHFGAKGMDDFTKTKDEDAKSRYIDRHSKREDWTESGILTAGFWAKHILWNKPTIEASLRSTKTKYKL